MSKIKFLLLSVVLVLFTFGCGGGGGGSSSSTPELQNMDVKVYGTYNGGTGKFYAESGSGLTGDAWALNTTAGEYALTGKLTDGAIIFNLTGVYNSVTKTYSLSAASSVLVFQIRGSIDDTGEMTDGEVSVKTTGNGGNTWTVTNYPATVVATAPTINGTVDPSQQTGLPAKWLGVWYGEFYGDKFYISVTPWSITSYWDDGGGKWFSDPTGGDYMDIVNIDWTSPNIEAKILTLGGYPTNTFDPDAFVMFNAKELSATQVEIGTYGDPVTQQDAFVNKADIPSTFAHPTYMISRSR